MVDYRPEPSPEKPTLEAKIEHDVKQEPIELPTIRPPKQQTQEMPSKTKITEAPETKKQEVFETPEADHGPKQLWKAFTGEISKVQDQVESIERGLKENFEAMDEAADKPSKHEAKSDDTSSDQWQVIGATPKLAVDNSNTSQDDEDQENSKSQGAFAHIRQTATHDLKIIEGRAKKLPVLRSLVPFLVLGLALGLLVVALVLS